MGDVKDKSRVLISGAMGSRVNYVLVRDALCKRYAQGGGAGYGLDYHFAAGPDITLRWLAQLDDYRDDFWFDDLVCEGGVLIDVDARRLLLFTELGQFYLHERYAYRAGLLDAYRRTWSGWTVSWAYDGIADLAAYLGENRDQVRRDSTWWNGLYPDGGERPDGPVEYLVSVADADGCRAYALPFESCPPWLLGPRLLDRLDPRDLVTACSTHPTAGLHLDPARRRAGLWTIRPLAGLTEDWSELWPGWELELWATTSASSSPRPAQRSPCLALTSPPDGPRWPTGSTGTGSSKSACEPPGKTSTSSGSGTRAASRPSSTPASPPTSLPRSSP